MATRFIPNNIRPLLTLSDPGTHLRRALEDIVTNYPPRDSYPPEVLHGLWAGPTGIAYLFLHISASSPKLAICGRPAIEWSHEYLKGGRGHLVLEAPRCGLNCEKLSFESVRAAVTKDVGHVQEFVGRVHHVLADDFPDELLYGRVGVLYMLRMVRHWVPNSAPLVEKAIATLTGRIMAGLGTWNFRGKRYIGAVHGEIGIVAQLVLTTPPLAPQLEVRLAQLLDIQLEDGNWPTQEGGTSSDLLQFCHGAPGFLFSLFSLRSFYPGLEARMDAAIQKGRELIWRDGLLRKEPSICHGIIGNGLTLPPGPRREHFLAMTTAEMVAEAKKEASTLFEPADYGHKYSTLMSYAPSAAWAWTQVVGGKEFPRILIYNDI